MKKLLLLSAVALIATGANATDIKPYVEGKISQNWMKANYKDDEDKMNFKDNVFGGALEVGAKIDQFRVGLEGYYNDKAEDKMFNILPVELKSKGVFLNGYWDVPFDGVKNLKPYVGAGIGYSWLEETADGTGFGLWKDTIKDKDWGYNVGAGIAYGINDKVDLTLGYRYEYLGKIKDEDSKTKFTNHKVSLGLRYTF